MEPGVSIEDGCRIRVVVRAVGEVPAECLSRYVDLVSQHSQIELSSLSPFYTAHQKSPFARQPWDDGCLRLKFVVGKYGRSQWEDYQAYRRVHGFIGVCHCPSSPDLEAVYERFADMFNDYPSAQSRRLLAFQPSDEQVKQEDKKRQNMVLLPPAEVQTLQHHMQTLMQELAASLLMTFESRVVLAEQMGAILTTPMDSQVLLTSEDVSKAKRRRLERVQKIIGDYCLLAGSPLDAVSHYTTAIELSRHHTGDTFWNAGALEGTICAILLPGGADTPLPSDEEIRYRYYEVIQLYRRSGAPFLEVEATLKLARFLCSRGELGKNTSREVAELLTGAVEVGKGLSDRDDHVLLFVEVARLFSAIHYERKSAFFARQVAQMYQANNSPRAAKSALQILLLASATYRVDGTSKSGLQGDHWNGLQISMLGDILAAAVRAGDPLTAWIAGARLLRFHYPFITPSAQTSLVSALSSAAERLPPGTRCSEPGLPFVRLLSAPLLPPGADIIRKAPGRKDWWVQSSSAGGPFIYTPILSKAAAAASSESSGITWVMNESVEVMVEVANPCAFEVSVQEVCLSTLGASFEAFPLSVTLPPSTSQVLPLCGVPRQAGSLTLRGCYVNHHGVTTEHLFEDVEDLLVQAAKGAGLVDPFRGGAQRSGGLPSPLELTVLPALPLLSAHVVGGGDGDIVLFEGEVREVQLCLSNVGTLAVEQAHVTVGGKQQRDHTISINQASLEAALPLQPDAAVFIPVTLRAGETSTEAEGTTKSHPLVLVHYAGPDAEASVGRQLALPLQLHVQKGLCLVQARLVSAEAAAHVEASMGLLELELWNPTQLAFEVEVTLEGEDEAWPRTRIDPEYSSRLLVPLDTLMHNRQESIEELSTRIRLKWQSARSSVGDLNVADAVKAALRASVADIVDSSPLTFGFRLGKNESTIQAHELTQIEMLVRNNSKDTVSLVLSIVCRDVAGASCFESEHSSALWSGLLKGIEVDVPAFGQHVHPFVLCFMIPGQYTLLGQAARQVDAAAPAVAVAGPPFAVQVVA